MSKTKNWFKHPISAGNDIGMQKMCLTYGHWGKGIYWDVVEVLGESDNYQYPLNTDSAKKLFQLIRGDDFEKFRYWFKNCIDLGLFIMEEGKFHSKFLLPPKKKKAAVVNSEWKEDHMLKILIKRDYPTVAKLKEPTVKEMDTLLSKHQKNEIEEVLKSMENFKDLLNKYTSAYLTLTNWLSRRSKNKKITSGHQVEVLQGSFIKEASNFGKPG